MKSYAGILTAALIALAGAAAYADGSTTAAQPAVYMPSTIKWEAGTGPFKGVMVAMLDGDPTQAGPYTFRLKLPDGTKFPVHYHLDTERVTVISGTFLVGIGTMYDASKMTALPAGSFVVVPAGVRHYAAAQGETIVQLSGMGPFAMKMDPAPSGM